MSIFVQCVYYSLATRLCVGAKMLSCENFIFDKNMLYMRTFKFKHFQILIAVFTMY
jgi:hypothetical protein